MSVLDSGIDGDPLADVSILLDRDRFKHIILGGETVHIDRARYNPLKVSDFAMTFWNDLYTQERVAEWKLIERGPKIRREIAEAVVAGSTPYGE